LWLPADALYGLATSGLSDEEVLRQAGLMQQAVVAHDRANGHATARHTWWSDLVLAKRPRASNARRSSPRRREAMKRV
jgi:hypothetical protein